MSLEKAPLTAFGQDNADPDLSRPFNMELPCNE
jgi:hypothetical protein